MVMPAKDLTGQVFGFLTVTRRAGSSAGANKKARWECLCRCGRTVVRESQYLRTKNRTTVRSCGCLHGNQTHKMSKTRPYRIWVNMRRRCGDPRDKDWANYGGRGVTVCASWAESFDVFWQDVKAGYAPHLTLGRLDNDGPYSPQNCRWETPSEQARNRRSSRYLDTPKGRMTLEEAATAFGVKPVTLGARLDRYKWSLEKALGIGSTT